MKRTLKTSRSRTLRRSAGEPGPIADLRLPADNADVRGLLACVQALQTAVRTMGRSLSRNWRPYLGKREYLTSAANLAAYIALRRHDLRPIQDRLATLGLSSLGRCEGHVMAALEAVIFALKQMTGMRVPR